MGVNVVPIIKFTIGGDAYNYNLRGSNGPMPAAC